MPTIQRFTTSRPCGLRALMCFLTAFALMAPRLARADNGAFTVEAGGGVAVLRAPAPYADNSAAQVGTVPEILIGGRYALTNRFELSLAAFGEPSESFFVPGTTINSDAGKLSGTLQMNVQRYGILAGVRFLHGNVWRLIVGADAGWSLSMYSSMHLLDDSGASAGRDFGLNLPDKNINSLILAPSAGISWVGDKLSVTVLPRFEVLVGGTTTWAISIPITIGWDFYL
jgi:hypothetical protein